MNLALVSSQTDKENKDAEYLANANQKGGGNTNDKIEAKEKFTVQSTTSNMGTSSREQFESSTKDQTKGNQNFLSQIVSDFKMSKLTDQNKIKSNQNVDHTEIVMREREITQLTKDLQKFTATHTKKKIRIKYIKMDTKKSKDAGYLSHFKKRVEKIGNQFYPKKARDAGLKGSVLMVIAMSPSGSVIRIRIDSSSGHKILDEAAKKFVRQGSPFGKVPNEVMENKDELNIVFRYKFRTEGGRKKK